MKLLVGILSVLLMMLSLQCDLAFAATASDCDPVYEEFTDATPCDYNCQNICNPLKDVCVCRYGYLRDLNSGRCIPQDQCTPEPQDITFGCLAS